MDTQQDPIAALLKHNAIQIEKQEVSLGTRKRIFDDKTDKVENYVRSLQFFDTQTKLHQLQLIAAQHGFHSTLIIAGGNVHSDGGVARVIETPGARGVSQDIPFLFCILTL